MALRNVARKESRLTGTESFRLRDPHGNYILAFDEFAKSIEDQKYATRKRYCEVVSCFIDYLPLTRLTQVHRQAASTGIPAAAASIRAHCVPDIAEYRGQSVGVSFAECSAEMVIPKLLELADRWQGEDYQILCATKKQQAAINLAFHDVFGGSKRLTGWSYAVGDPVIHLVNDYERGLMNGTLGRIVDVVEGGLQIDFDGEFHILETGELGERLSLAYAISVHKSQGSQFKRVAIVSTASRIYDHALVYTGLTRAVEQAVFVGERTAFTSAVQNPPAAQRRQVGFRPTAQRVRDVEVSLM
jgi:exodeoxyribonuclease V alpha subunit